MNKIGDFLLQLWRRGVFRAATAYVVGAWVLIEIVSVLAEVFEAPDVLMPVLFTLLALGLPAALAFSWYFDITPDGIRRTEEIAVDAPQRLFDRRIDFVIISLLTAALILSVYGNLREEPEPPQSVSILIADFDNETGNELFTGIIEESLRVGLEVAPFVESYSRQSAANIAANITDSEELSVETAGLVALREGINIVIGGSVRREGGGLVATASGFAPGDQSELFSVTERAEADVDILNAVSEISRELRLALGDTEKPVGAGESESFVVANLEAAAEYLKAQNLQFDRKLEEAVVQYEKAVQLDPEFARAYAGLALTLEYLGRSEAASPHWEKALSGLNTLTERGQLRTLGNYYVVNQRDYDKALDTYERLVERYPADNVAHNNLAVAAFYAMDFDRALEVGREVAERFPNHSAYGANLALYAMYAGRFDEASDVAKQVIDIESSSAYAHFVIAQTEAMAGNLDEAERTYETMSGLGRFAQSVAVEGIADLALYRGDVSNALEILDTGIAEEMSLGALNTAALKHVMRADAYLLSGDNEQAIAAAQAGVDIGAGDPAVLVPAAMTFVQLGEYERAQSLVDTLSEGFSKSRRAYADALRAYMASSQGDSEAAIIAANAAIETEDLWLIRLIRANAYLAANQPDNAAADLLVCDQRIGEGIAVFLNDRPSLRILLKLEAAKEKLGS
ncbi:MAG: tetratricopeptide repeat protein [Woeseiaceae bacterium]|nr:tetratricopeptide repeat protein [Woeseiaceae bacterium]